MKNQLKKLLDEAISPFDVFIDDAFIREEEGHKILDIVVDSNEIIDLKRIERVSRIINKILDKEEKILENIDELDIYSKEKGDS